MIYRRKTYKIMPHKLELFNAFFHDYLLPNQMKHGAKLVGRWVTENKDEITAIWEYSSIEAYYSIEEVVRNDEMAAQARLRKEEIEPLYIESSQDFLTSTGTYSVPKHIVSAFGWITNDNNETLLVKTFWRADTWEFPGGQIEENETIDEGVKREILEESGIEARLTGITGVYQNISKGIVTIGFRGVAVGGSLTSSDETQRAEFIRLTPDNITDYITRPQFITRARDALNGSIMAFEAFRLRPYELISRIENNI